jgi:hypothetical protein
MYKSDILPSVDENCVFYWFTYKDMFIAKKGSLNLLIFDINRLELKQYSSILFNISANLNMTASMMSDNFNFVEKNEWDHSVGRLKNFNERNLYFVNELAIGDADQYTLNVVCLNTRTNTPIWINAGRFSSYSVNFDENSSIYLFTKADRIISVYDSDGVLVNKINFTMNKIFFMIRAYM